MRTIKFSQIKLTIDLKSNLPGLTRILAGAEFLVGGNFKTTLSCDGLDYGYYADHDNDCKLFHICQSFKMSDGSIFNNHWNFMCGNQTVSNQVFLSCSYPEDAVPCENAR